MKLTRENIKESNIERIQHEEEAKVKLVDMNVDSRPISYDTNNQENESSRKVYHKSEDNITQIKIYRDSNKFGVIEILQKINLLTGKPVITQPA